MLSPLFFFFFFNDTATTEIYTLSLHDALPILILESVFCRKTFFHTSRFPGTYRSPFGSHRSRVTSRNKPPSRDRKSTRLNSSHSQISYAVFCLKKKKHQIILLACDDVAVHSVL